MNKEQFTPGQRFNTFYGNGSFSGIVQISRVTDKSVFILKPELNLYREYREGINSVKRYISKKLWVAI